MNKPSLLTMFQIIGLLYGPQQERPTQISSHKIKQKKIEEQLSCRQIQRMKGKKARKNRGKNRRSE